MAERKVQPSTVLLLIDPLGGTAYSTVICLTDHSLDRTTNVVDAASYCGPDKSPGVQDVKIPFNGQQMLQPASSRISGPDLHDIWNAKTTIGWKIGPAAPVTGDVNYTGTGFISDLSDKYTTADVATFSGTIEVKGTVTKTVTA